MANKITTGLVALAMAAGIGCNNLDTETASSKVWAHVTVIRPEGCHELISAGIDVDKSVFYDVATCRNENGNFVVYIKPTGSNEWTAREWR